VVLGQLLERVVAYEVGARVADVADANGVAVEQRDGHRRAHARGGRVRAGALVHASVGLLDQPGDILFPGRFPFRMLNGGRREVRSDLAGLRTAHAVGDREQRRVADVRVLVPPPPPAGVGDRSCARQRHRW